MEISAKVQEVVASSQWCAI